MSRSVVLGDVDMSLEGLVVLGDAVLGVVVFGDAVLGDVVLGLVVLGLGTATPPCVDVSAGFVFGGTVVSFGFVVFGVAVGPAPPLLPDCA